MPCSNSEIKSGDLIAWTGSSFLGKLVRVFTMSEYSHVGIVVEEADGLYVIEAARPVVRKSKLTGREPMYHIPLDVDFTPEAYVRLHASVGDKYSMLQAALSFIGLYIDDRKWYCTELAYDFYVNSANFAINKRLTPTEFVSEMLNKYGSQINYIGSK